MEDAATIAARGGVIGVFVTVPALVGGYSTGRAAFFIPSV